MPTLNELLIFDIQNEYESAYDLSLNPNFSSPKIYNANGDLSKRWYVYFSFRDPSTGKMKRVTPIYGKANKFKTKEERLTVLTVYRKKLLQLLKKGYNPYADNSSLYNQSNQTLPVPKKVEIQRKKEVATVIEQEPKMAIKEALEFGLQLKEKLVNPTTKRSYENKAKLFLKWLNENHPTLVTVDALDKKLMTNFLNSVLIKSSPRNRNNFRTELGSVLQVLEDNEIITENVFKKIPVLKTKPKRHKPYTEKKKNEIFSNLEKEDPILLFFIKFVAYGFMRPVEVCRVRVGDIDVVNRTVKFKAKNSDYKTKLIPQLLWDELPDLSKLDKDALLFTPNTIGGDWDAEAGSRREHFTNRFRAIVKIPFKLGADYTMYSFRHTYTVKVYREFRKKYAPFEAKSRLMLITGHTSMSALEKYLRDIDAELPKDYSEMLES